MLSSFGQRVRVEVVRQIEAPGRQRQALSEQLRAQPHFAQIQFVLALESRRVAIEQRQAGNLRVGRRPAQGDDVGEEHGVLRDAGGEEQVGRRQRVGAVVDEAIVALGPLRELRRDGGVDADLHAVLLGVGERLFDLLVDRLAAIDALATVGHDRLRARHLLVVLLAVLVDEHLDAADARFRFGQHRVRFEVRDSLLQSATCCSSSCRSASAACAADAASSVISSCTFWSAVTATPCAGRRSDLPTRL